VALAHSGHALQRRALFFTAFRDFPTAITVGAAAARAGSALERQALLNPQARA
jgi:hypothetical protein